MGEAFAAKKHAEAAYRVVAQAFAHLLAIFGQDEAVADQALEGRLLKQGRGQHHEGVEPATRLVNACIANRC